jgi:hypothetical protein
MPLPRIRQDGALFVDANGRQIMLRGVNLGGDCKVPYPDGGTENPSDFSDHRDVSFIGRPFPLEEADEHLGRLAHWGFNVLRLLTTWEAVEHKGPGEYDAAYLDYYAEVARRAGEHGLYVFVDFHQDVWSRMTGGDGAPAWLFDAVGMDMTKFAAAGAAHVMQAEYDYASSEKLQPSYPQMSWGSNYKLSVNGIMWTLFWGGRLLTPDFKIDGENVQDFLQRHYLGSMDQIARRLKDMPNVLGFDTLNEPGPGWMGERLTYRHLASSNEKPERPRVGPALSPLDALAVAQGITVTVPTLKRDKSGVPAPVGNVTVNPNGVSIWKDAARCPFEQHGAYRIEDGKAVALNDEFLRVANGRTLSLSEDGYGPLFHKVAEVTRAHQPDWSVFVEMDPFARAARRFYPADLPERSVNAGHWYDASTLYMKRFHSDDHYCAATGAREVGLDVIGARYAHEMAGFNQQTKRFPGGGAPSLVGEFGIPYDLDEGAAYEEWRQGKRDGVWKHHVEALSLMYDALDTHGLHSTQWNYTASNRNDLTIGDRWNQEDLSIFSRDQQDDPSNPDSGGRAIEGFCRTYARAIQGRLTKVVFDHATARFTMAFEADADIDGVTEVYVPRLRYPHGYITRLEGVPAELHRGEQSFTIRALASGPATLLITPIWPSHER